MAGGSPPAPVELLTCCGCGLQDRARARGACPGRFGIERERRARWLARPAAAAATSVRGGSLAARAPSCGTVALYKRTRAAPAPGARDAASHCQGSFHLSPPPASHLAPPQSLGWVCGPRQSSIAGRALTSCKSRACPGAGTPSSRRILGECPLLGRANLAVTTRTAHKHTCAPRARTQTRTHRHKTHTPHTHPPPKHTHARGTSTRT
jgi:hypothetical protein